MRGSVRTWRVVLPVAALALSGVLPTPAVAPGPAQAAPPAVRDIRFPVARAVSFRDDFGAPRGCCRTHEGNDLFGKKLAPIVSASDGVVVRWGLHNGRTLSGNYLVVEDAAGWEYKYIHLNNDSPGTDDGANPPRWRFAPGIFPGARVQRGQHLGYLGDSGNAEGTPPHLHFEIHVPSGAAINPWYSLLRAANIPVGTRCTGSTNPAPKPTAASASGYWVYGPDGGVMTFGGARFLGSMGGKRLNRPIVGMASTPASDGYWMVATDGGIFTFGKARFHGSTGHMRLNKPIVGMARHPNGLGYWLVASDGGIFTFGKARFHGSTGSIRLNKPIVGMTPTNSGLGYWLVASDGGIFAFGDARFRGSTGSIRLNSPIAAMAVGPNGYWLVAADGGMFAFGGARYHGSVPGTGNCGPVRVTGFAPSATKAGYWVQANDGRTWAFGDARDYGDPWRRGLRPRVLGIVPTPPA